MVDFQSHSQRRPSPSPEMTYFMSGDTPAIYIVCYPHARTHTCYVRLCTSCPATRDCHIYYIYVPHTRTYTRAHTHTHTHTHMHVMPGDTPADIHLSNTRARTHTRAHERMEAGTHARAQTHTRTDTHQFDRRSRQRCALRNASSY